MSNDKNSWDSFTEDALEGFGHFGIMIFGLAGLAICGNVILALLTESRSYNQQPIPINYCYGFYYFTVVYPFKLGMSIYTSLCSNITPYPNLNLIISIFSTLLYASLYIFLWYLLIFPSPKRRTISLLAFFTPAIVAVLVHLFRWLFAQR